MLTTAFFTVVEMYFAGSHATSLLEYTAETTAIRESVRNSLVTHGLDVRNTDMAYAGIMTGYQQSITWRVDVTYAGDPIPIDAMFIASMGSDIRAMGGPHTDSLWQADIGLTTVSHEPLS